MKFADYLPWFEDLLIRFGFIPCRQGRTVSGVPAKAYDHEGAQAWASEAGSALAAVFPHHDFCRQTWDRLVPQMDLGQPHGGSLEQMLGVLKAGTQQMRDNRLGSISAAVRVETEDELLDQALGLLNAKHIAAAAVIAGGALVTHLRHL